MTDDLIRKVIEDLTRKFARLENKFDQIEKDVSAMKTQQAIRDVQYEQIVTTLRELKSGINRVFWAVGLAILAAIVEFILRGGLHGG